MRKQKQKQPQETRQRVRPVVFRLLLYPAIFAAAALPSTIFRIISFLDPHNSSSPFIMAISSVAQISFRLTGFFNAIALGTSNLQIKQQLLRQLCGCCQSQVLAKNSEERRPSNQRSLILST